MLKKSYWDLGVNIRGEDDDAERISEEFKKVLSDGCIRPTGIHLERPQSLSPLKGCVFLAYGWPFTASIYSMKHKLEYIKRLFPVFEFDTRTLFENGAFLGKDLDGGLWAAFDEIEKEVFSTPRCENTSDGDLLSQKIRAHFEAEALFGGDAIDYIESLSDEELSGGILEIYYPGTLPLESALNWAEIKAANTGT